MGDLAEDLRHNLAAWDDGPGRLAARTLAALPLYPRVSVVVLYRLSSWCWRRRARPLALWLEACAVRRTGAEIHPAARFGRGLGILHSVGIVVGPEVVAGDGVVLAQGVTLGETGRAKGAPHLGDNVRIGAGAKVLGAVHIGDRAVVGANAVVLGDVPAGATVTGVWRGPERDGTVSVGEGEEAGAPPSPATDGTTGRTRPRPTAHGR